MDWQVVSVFIALTAAIGGAIFAVFRTLSGVVDKASGVSEKSLTLREHNEYKEATSALMTRFQQGQNERLAIKTFDDWRAQFWRDMDRLEREIKMLENNKPSTAELERTAKAIEQRMQVLEDHFRAMIIEKISRKSSED